MRLRPVAALMPVVIVLTACDAAVLLDDAEETTILTSDTFVLTQSPVRLSSNENAKAVGGETAVCVVLAKDVVDGDTEGRQAIYDSILGDIAIFGTLHIVGGTTVRLVNGEYSWSREGELVAQGELASCLRLHPDDKLPIGTEFDWVELSSSEEISALGVFVYSTSKWDPRQ